MLLVSVIDLRTISLFHNYVYENNSHRRNFFSPPNKSEQLLFQLFIFKHYICSSGAIVNWSRCTTLLVIHLPFAAIETSFIQYHLIIITHRDSSHLFINEMGLNCPSWLLKQLFKETGFIPFPIHLGGSNHMLLCLWKHTVTLTHPWPPDTTLCILLCSS